MMTVTRVIVSIFVAASHLSAADEAVAQPPGFGFSGGGEAARQLAPEELDVADGVAQIADHATFQRMSYKGEEVMIDTFLAGLEFVKFTIDDALAPKPNLYFINTVNHRAHMMFGRAAGLPRGGWEQMKGVLVYRPRLKSPSGNPGLFTFEFEPFDEYTLDMVQFAQDKLIEKMPILKGNIGYYPPWGCAGSIRRGKREVRKFGSHRLSG